MKSATAKRYAKALIEVGREEKEYARYGKELRTAMAVFAGSPELYKVLLNPMYRVEERRALVGDLAKSLELSGAVTRFLEILVDARKIRLLEEIGAAYSRLEDELSGRLRAVVESPAELDAAAVEEIRKRLGEATGKEVVLELSVDASLIGGLVVRIDNTILDGSVRTQLDLMRERILGGAA